MTDYVELHTRNSRSFPSAVSFVSKLNGCSQPSIVMSTGCELWVMKFRRRGGTNALMHEVIGTELMARMGLPVPQWSAIEVTDEFLDRFPESWFQNSSGESIRPEAGLHFGSRLTLSEEGSPTYQVIPKSWHGRIANRSDFAGALAVDLWMNNCDRRQCLFLTKGRSLSVMFIDHDCSLGGFKGEAVTCPRLLMMPSPELFVDALDDRVATKWRRKIDAMSADTIDRILAMIPTEWADGAALQRVRLQLAARRNQLDSLLARAVTYLRESAVGVQVSCQPAIRRRIPEHRPVLIHH